MKNDLVSVVVLTYNSSNFILETLESIKDQTYGNIELIITDDASQDNTIDICEEWIKNNNKRFTNLELLNVSKNTGISANYNRGLKAANGIWAKTLAGDDALLSNSIEDNMNYFAAHPEIRVLFSYCRMYAQNLTEDCFIKLNPSSFPSTIINDEITAAEQYKLLLICNRIPFAPSIVFHLDTQRKYGIVDEKFSFSEDYQLWLSFTKNGFKLFFMEKQTTKYRIHDESVSNQLKKFVINPIYFKTEPSIKALSYPHLPWDLRFSRIHSWYANHIFKIGFLNRKTKFNSFLHYSLTKLLNPFSYIIYIKSHYIEKYKNDVFYK